MAQRISGELQEELSWQIEHKILLLYNHPLLSAESVALANN